MSPRSARSSVLALVVLALGGAPACSALVAPDTSRLGGGIDGGRADGGGVVDGSVVDAGGPVDGGGTDGGVPACSVPADCDDGVACTTDACGGGTCSNAPNDAACADGERCNPTMGCVAIVCTSDATCSDGDACNGMERCAPGTAGADARTGCVLGGAVSCDDGVTCTVDSCDPDVGCVHASNDALCDDAIGCTLDVCTATAPGSGCAHTPDDTVCATDPCTTGATCSAASGCSGGAPRDCRDGNVCTVDACDGSVAGFCTHAAVDADMDGAPAARVGGTTCGGGTDCNDANAAIRPGIAEVCGNTVDDNCNGTVDEGCTAGTGESCASPFALTLSGDPAGTRTARFDGDFGTFADNYLTPCGRSGGRDAVLALTIDRASDVRIETTGTPVDTVLAVSAPTCDSSAWNTACNDDADPGNGTASRIWLHRVAPVGGSLTVYILVDGFDGGVGGAFRVDVQVTPVRSDTCGVGEPLDITGGGLVLGVSPGLSSVVGAQRGSCDPDFVDTDVEAAILRFTGPGDNRVWSLQAQSTAFTPTLYVRQSTCTSTTEVACNTMGNLTGGFNVTSGTRYFVFVDGVPTGTTTPLAYRVTYDP